MIYPLFLMKALEKGFVGILLTLDTLIYGLISSAFRVFMALAGARLLSSSAYTEIANKIYIVVGVLMLFVLSYAILKAIVDPDQATKGDLGPKMIKNVVVAVVGLAIAPVLFNLMYQAQGLILENDVLGRLFFRTENTQKIDTGGAVVTEDGTITFESQINPDEYVKSVGGAVTATSLWQAFFYPSEDSNKSPEDIVANPLDYFSETFAIGLFCAVGIAAGVAGLFTGPIGWLAFGATVITCIGAGKSAQSATSAFMKNPDKITLQEAYAMTSAGESFGIYTVFINAYVDDGDISYLFGISTIAGAFALFAFVSFSIDMGVRAAKLAYLQIIAPVPLVMQVLPKFKDSFNSYVKSVTSTFMEVFIRISVVYIVVYIICHLMDLFSSVSTWTNNNGLSDVEQLFALAFLILGLIAFCRKAPEIITETLHLPKGNMHLGIGEKLKDGGFFAAKSIVGGGIRGARNNWDNTKGKMITDKFGKQRAITGRERVMSALDTARMGAMEGARLSFPEGKFGKMWRDSNINTEKAANKANAINEAKFDLSEQNYAAKKARKEAWKRVVELENEFELKKGTAEEAAIRAKLQEARKAYETALANELSTSSYTANNLYNRAKAWTTGSISTEKEEAAIRFSDGLDNLKSKLREEAYNKHNPTKALKSKLTELEAKKISEYRDGWDDESYNAELRRRYQQDTKYVQLEQDFASKKALSDKMMTDLNSARSALSSARAAGADAATIANLEVAVTNAQNSYDVAYQAEIASQELLDAQRKQIVGNLDIVAKYNESEMLSRRTKHQAEIKATKDAMEASADAYVQEMSIDPTNKVYRIISDFFNDGKNSEYIRNNPNAEVIVGYEKDANGNDDPSKPIKESLSSVLSKGFGESVITRNKFEPTADYGKQSQFDVKLPNGDVITYKLEGDDYVPYQTDANGNKTRVTSSEYPSYNKDEFFDRIRRDLITGKIKKSESKTSISVAGDVGKATSSYITRTSLAEKNRKKQEAQKQKEGKK